jgi:methylmalonyl-CoA/ethylmalonyl-CoA epimerase
VSTVFVKLGNTNIELLHPLGDDSPISKFLEKKPSGGMHHMCLEVDNIKKAIESLMRNNIHPIDPEPKVSAM